MDTQEKMEDIDENTIPLNYEGRSLLIRMKKRHYTDEETCLILNNLGFDINIQAIQRVWSIYEEKMIAKSQRESHHRPNNSNILDSEKIKQMTYLFLNNQEMTVNKASELFAIGKPAIRRYMIQFGIGCAKGKGQKFERFTFRRQNRGKMSESELMKLEEEDLRKMMNRPLIQEPSPIDPLSEQLWKKVEIRIIFPKIRYGQVHQWERYYDRLVSEIQLRSVKWIDFKRGEKFTGKGCYIYILSEYDQNVYLDNFTLEKFLETSLPEDFFAGNCLNTNKIRVFDYPYIPSQMAEEDLISLSLPKQEIFAKVANKISSMNPMELQQLNAIAKLIHQQYQNDQTLQRKNRIKPIHTNFSHKRLDKTVTINDNTHNNTVQQDNQLQLIQDIKNSFQVLKQEYPSQNYNDQLIESHKKSILTSHYPPSSNFKPN